MKIVKITDKTFTADDEGYFRVYCQVLFGNSYRYLVLLFDSLEGVRGIKKGDNVDSEKTKYSFRTSTQS